MLVPSLRSVVAQPAALSRTHGGVADAPSYAPRGSQKSRFVADDERLSEQHAFASQPLLQGAAMKRYVPSLPLPAAALAAVALTTAATIYTLSVGAAAPA